MLLDFLRAMQAGQFCLSREPRPDGPRERDVAEAGAAAGLCVEAALAACERGGTHGIWDTILTGAFNVDVFDEGEEFARVFGEEIFVRYCRFEAPVVVSPCFRSRCRPGATTHGKGCDRSRAAGFAEVDAENQA